MASRAAEDVTRKVRALIVAGEAYRRAWGVAVGLGVSDAAVLGHLYYDHGLTPGELAAKLQMSPASVTAMVDRMEVTSYLTRRPNPDDRRSVLIDLTPAGTQVMQEAFDAFAADLGRAIHGTSLPHLEELSALLDQLTAALYAGADEVSLDGAHPRGGERR